MKNLKVVFIHDLNFLTGNCNEGDEYVLTKDDAEYFSEYVKVIEETDEDAISFS